LPPFANPRPGPTALQGYEPRVNKAISQLLAVIEREKGQPLDLAQWFAYLIFDIMEDLSFNKNSHMVESGEDGYVFKTIRADMWNIAFFSHIPWLLPFLKRTPLLNREYLRFYAWIQKQIDERRTKEPDQPDIFSPILRAYEKGPQTLHDQRNLHGDAQLVVVAGSDSVVAALVHLFFELAWDRGLVRRLQAEFDALPNLEHDSLQTVALLDAVINETLRLHPPVPSGTQRVTPAEGLHIGDVYVPGDTIVQVPSYTVFRDERNFERATEFVPERWTTRPEMIKDRSVYIPFNTGMFKSQRGNVFLFCSLLDRRGADKV
jgi:cytochrome P450